MTILTILLFTLVGANPATAGRAQPALARDLPQKYFKIQVVDRQTGRGVPLVRLRTVNNIRYYTDSNGIVAFYEPGLMNREVFFFVGSHGYEFRKDGFGFRGTSLKTLPGGSALLTIDRVNIAERLYRITGQGIYRDSVLTGHAVPLAEPLLNGQVLGQDSVYTCVYRGHVFWMWGDTSRPSYPLGHFGMAGAVSNLPNRGGLDPAVGVDLRYYVGKNGFSRPLCRLEEPGMIWLDGLIKVKDRQGRDHMVAKYARMKSLGEAKERGLMVFNDESSSFEPIVRSGPDFLLYPNSGHAFAVDVKDQRYYYFGTQFPLAVRMRVKARWDCAIDPNCHEVLTSVRPGAAEKRLNRPSADKRARWIDSGTLLGRAGGARSTIIEALKQEKATTRLYDIESGTPITPHGGSVHYNAYRRRWVMIMVQQGGDSSYLGEVWYAEADTPVGQWAYARKIATHNKYSFYNPKQHPLFDQDGGRVIFFEGTYTFTFSGNAENATPRYDYNQIMYRLNLDDPRLMLPVAVYKVRDGQDAHEYLLRGGVEKARKWDSVAAIQFFAVEPDRPRGKMVGLYARKIPCGNGQTLSLSLKPLSSSAKPLFYALPSTHEPDENSCTVSLYEYRHTDTGQRLYCTNPQVEGEYWTRANDPLCCVWKTPAGPLLLDSDAKPTTRD